MFWNWFGLVVGFGFAVRHLVALSRDKKIIEAIGVVFWLILVMRYAMVLGLI